MLLGILREGSGVDSQCSWHALVCIFHENHGTIWASESLDELFYVARAIALAVARFVRCVCDGCWNGCC